MVIINTNAIEVSIHAVSPEFNVGAGAGGGTTAGAAPGATASAPNTSTGKSASSPTAIAPYILFLLIFVIILLPLFKELLYLFRRCEYVPPAPGHIQKFCRRRFC